MDTRIYVQHQDEMLAIPLNLVRDTKISLEAKGLYCLLDEHMDDFDSIVKAVVDRSPAESVISREKIRELVDQLIQRGYLADIG